MELKKSKFLCKTFVSLYREAIENITSCREPEGSAAGKNQEIIIPPPSCGEVTHSLSALQTSCPHTLSSPPISHVRPLIACSSPISLCLNIVAVWDFIPSLKLSNP